MSRVVKELVFQRNTGRPHIYDLVGKRSPGFTFVRLSRPRAEFLIRQGAEYVIESWDHGTKSLFTGLIPLGGGFYYGDRKEGRKRSLMVVKLNPPELLVYLFRTYPRQLRSVLTEFIKQKAPWHYPSRPMSPTNPATGEADVTNIQFLPSIQKHD
jgi:hypothetical protein